MKNVSIQVVNNDQLKFTYDIPALSNLDKIYFDVFPMGGSTASLSGSTRRYDSPFGGVTGVTHTLDGHLPPGTYIVKIHTEFTGNRSVSETVTYDNNGRGYTVNPGSVTLRVPVKEWNVSTAANQSVSNSVYGSVYSAPVSGVTVTIVDDNDFRHTMTANTSTDGVAVFNHLYPGLYRVGITNSMNGEIDETIVQDPVFVFGSQVSHTLQTISNMQPTRFNYRQGPNTPTGKISGYVSWYPSSGPLQPKDYRFYFEDGKGNRLGDMILDTPFDPSNTNYSPVVPETNIPTGAIGIRLYTFDGTSEHITPDFASLWNDSMLPLHASMQSTDPTKNNLSGTIKWDAASNETGISSYVIMPDFQTIDGNNERNEIRIAEIPATGASAYSYNLSDFMLLDNYNSPSKANQYMIGVQNVMGELLGYLNSGSQFVPYTSDVTITPYSPDPGGNPGGDPGSNTIGATE
ncbi:hypothetical protein [Paenibacillus alginolyticus]|uniref:Carboxypeptidase-like regulatory domain-containing protein n=1 Tax=Paenibacillus alginolyticus TaxID=59839 RepID=A0ABT4G5T2_9BACL|nr:hypothetical protein [Paenibacillus alginolyticus]MCY9691544.1 carboxypeptidase-like regulatory domain-containing protein [Paenibacillus alginolyticus]